MFQVCQIRPTGHEASLELQPEPVRAIGKGRILDSQKGCPHLTTLNPQNPQNHMVVDVGFPFLGVDCWGCNFKAFKFH